MKRFALYILLLMAGGVYFFSNSRVYCDSTKVKGIVADAEDSAPLANVLVSISGTSKSAFTSIDGSFSISLAEPGNYEIEAFLAGYKTSKLTVYVKQGVENVFYIRMLPTGFTTDVITVTDDHPRTAFDDMLELSAVLKEKELLRDLGQTLALTLKNQTGISIRSMGPAPSRPVYRGLSGDRVMVTEDGMKT
ncbi:MAG: carboxypeptidase-like regulatory domain-containing protein, partial [Ignavibacteria bacterium]|nr:carboxypeptidase-like regulatory domain-containing protein [Ignavibacteria bacterium]